MQLYMEAASQNCGQTKQEDRLPCQTALRVHAFAPVRSGVDQSAPNRPVADLIYSQTSQLQHLPSPDQFQRQTLLRTAMVPVLRRVCPPVSPLDRLQRQRLSTSSMPASASPNRRRASPTWPLRLRALPEFRDRHPDLPIIAILRQRDAMSTPPPGATTTRLYLPFRYPHGRNSRRDSPPAALAAPPLRLPTAPPLPVRKPRPAPARGLKGGRPERLRAASVSR